MSTESIENIMKSIDAKITNKNYEDAVTKCDQFGLYNLGKLIRDIVGIPKLGDPVEREKDIKVQLMCNWISSESLRELLNKQSKGNFRWNRLVVVNNNPDYFVVINKPQPYQTVIPEKTVVFQMEPFMKRDSRYWGEWSSPDKSKFLRVLMFGEDMNNNEWHLGKTYTELKSNMKIEKTKGDLLSTVVSSKYVDQGHKLRIDFVKYLESKEYPIDIFGMSNAHKFRGYKGRLPLYCKDAGMFPYKYVFNAENNKVDHYYTEKIIDAILSESLIFYWGCPNIGDYIDERAFVRLDLNDFESDCNLIKKSIEENLWEKRLPYIKQAKKKIVEHLQFFPRLERILLKHENEKNEKNEEVPN